MAAAVIKAHFSAIVFRLHLWLFFVIVLNMQTKHRKTLATIFANPVNGNIEWSKIESLLVALGCRIVEGAGSSVTFERGGIRAYFHRPHPDKAALRYRIKEAREFLIKLGEKP